MHACIPCVHTLKHFEIMICYVKFYCFMIPYNFLLACMHTIRAYVHTCIHVHACVHACMCAYLPCLHARHSLPSGIKSTKNMGTHESIHKRICKCTHKALTGNTHERIRIHTRMKALQEYKFLRSASALRTHQLSSMPAHPMTHRIGLPIHFPLLW